MKREEELGDELMRFLERQILLQIIDNRWREHLYEMDYLREGIHLRGFALVDPLVAYKNEGFEMFRELMELDLGGVRKRHLPRRGDGRAHQLRARADAGAARRVPTRGAAPSSRSGARRGGRGRRRRGEATAGKALAAGPDSGNGAGENPVTVVKAENEKIGRNDPCWCGSGKKYKKCHGPRPRPPSSSSSTPSTPRTSGDSAGSSTQTS